MQGCAKVMMFSPVVDWNLEGLPQVRLGPQALSYRAPVRRFSVRQAGGWTFDGSGPATPVLLGSGEKLNST